MKRAVIVLVTFAYAVGMCFWLRLSLQTLGKMSKPAGMDSTSGAQFLKHNPTARKVRTAVIDSLIRSVPPGYVIPTHDRHWPDISETTFVEAPVYDWSGNLVSTPRMCLVKTPDREWCIPCSRIKNTGGCIWIRTGKGAPLEPEHWGITICGNVVVEDAP